MKGEEAFGPITACVRCASEVTSVAGPPVTLFGVPVAVMLGQLMLGLVNGSFYALLSLGLAVIFGLMGIVNFAHGAFYALGAFAALLGCSSLRHQLLVSAGARAARCRADRDSRSSDCSCGGCTGSIPCTACC